MITITHVGFAVEDLEKSLNFYQKIGFEIKNRFEREDLFAKAVFVEKDGLKFELWEFSGPETDFIKAIKKHVAYHTDNFEADLAIFEASGFTRITDIMVGRTVKKYVYLKDEEDNYFELCYF